MSLVTQTTLTERKPHLLQMSQYPSWDTQVLESHFVLHPYYSSSSPEQLIAEYGEKITAVATSGGAGLPKHVMDLLPNLEIIAIYGVGYDAVDIKEAQRRGIHVTNTPDVLTDDVADLAMTMMMAAYRDIVGAQEFVRTGQWANKGKYPLTRSITGKRAGIVGLGRIGQAVAKRCQAFNMPIAYYSRCEKDVASENGWGYIDNLVELAKQVDVLFLTLTGGADTHHIVDQTVLDALGKDGMLVNVSRASTVDESALLQSLTDKTLGYAALDVFENEPHLNAKFLELDNVLLQPHHASGTVETRKAMGKLMCDNLIAYFSNKPLLTPVV